MRRLVKLVYLGNYTTVTHNLQHQTAAFRVLYPDLAQLVLGDRLKWWKVTFHGRQTTVFIYSSLPGLEQHG
ncbi:hypothetical protein D3C81_2074780 [compost metagenome]